MNNYRKYFIKSIKDYYLNEFDRVIADTDNHYATISIDTKFASTSGNPIDKRLDFSAYFLAFIKPWTKRVKRLTQSERFVLK
ncbi:hypothetical protein GCM10027291_09880 [Telluribacter humicola]